MLGPVISGITHIWFSLGFNRDCIFIHDMVNYKSALQHPRDIEAYLTEEKQFGAIIGPFEKKTSHK